MGGNEEHTASNMFSKFRSFREDTQRQFSSFINAHSERINKGLNDLVDEVCQLQNQVSSITNEKNVLQTRIAMITNEKVVLQTQMSIITNEKDVLLETVANLNAEIRQMNAKSPFVTELQEPTITHNHPTHDVRESKKKTTDAKEPNTETSTGETGHDEGSLDFGEAQYQTLNDQTQGINLECIGDITDETNNKQDKYPLNGQNQKINKDKPKKQKDSKWMTVEACRICGKGYQRCHLYLCHYLVHSDKKEFECSLCGKLFESPTNLKEHMNLHGADKKYWHCCELCGKHFKHNATFDQHLRIHNGVKPFPCDLCNKSFMQKGNLEEHMRIHTGEKPYVCEVCAAAFVRKIGK